MAVSIPIRLKRRITVSSRSAWELYLSLIMIVTCLNVSTLLYARFEILLAVLKI